MNGGLITTAAAGSVNAPSITTTSRVTQNTTTAAANVSAMNSGVALFTRDAVISEQEDLGIANTLRNVPGYAAATS